MIESLNPGLILIYIGFCSLPKKSDSLKLEKVIKFKLL